MSTTLATDDSHVNKLVTMLEQINAPLDLAQFRNNGKRIFSQNRTIKIYQSARNLNIYQLSRFKIRQQLLKKNVAALYST
jgi:hypothetical protein